MSTSALPGLLGYAVLLPLISFFLILVLETISRVTRGGKSLGKAGGWIATGSILLSAIISFVCLIVWVNVNPPEGADHGPETVAHADQHAQEGQGTQGEGSHDKEKEDHGSAKVEAGDYYVLGIFGDLRLTIGYYIDSLTVVMFCMVTLIATCIHFYAMGYMAEELDTEVTDHEVTLKDGSPLKRPGRFPRFFQYMSLFCFSMLGLVLAGNIAMTFVFWELVGICSYFLIGFYVERKSASNAANKAFIVNRIGDFGMIIGLMALWAGMGTFAFGDYDYVDEKGETQHVTGMFSQVRPAENDHQLQAPDGMVQEAKSDEVAAEYRSHVALANSDRDEGSLTSEEILINTKSEVQSKTRQWREEGAGYWLLIVAGVGIFCGCMGKSAQFPLHTWLPDAMEGPTPVSALVHSATMVAAGVYLVGRFYPVFPVEVLLIIAIVGTITLFIGASIAIAATDIKRVLAYSTISQLGYMMLALGVGGWVAGMMHLITHAFFKSLLFMCSGSVIHAVHTNELPQMGGLFKKMPVTAITMLVGCFAITGASIPFLVGLSGYYSKDAILEQANSFMQTNDTPWAGIFFIIAAGGAAITAFYMFRMWFLTFVGKPRNQERFDHAHESPPVMWIPLVLLSVFAITVAWQPLRGGLPEGLIGSSICAAISLAFIIRHKRRQLALGATADDHNGHGHGGLSSKLIYLPFALSMIVLVTSLVWFAIPNVVLANLLEQSRPAGTAVLDAEGNFVATQGQVIAVAWPHEHASHVPSIKVPTTILAFAVGLAGIALAAAFYWLRILDPADVKKQFKKVHHFLLNKWWFDELYNFLFVRPVMVISRVIANFDRRVIDRIIDGLARLTRGFSSLWEKIADQIVVDGTVNLVASWVHSIGLSLRAVQRGRIREYVMFIILGTIVLFFIIIFFLRPALAGN